MSRMLSLLASVVAIMGLGPSAAAVSAAVANTSATFTTIDAPGAVNGTFAYDINDRGDIVGFFSDAFSQLHGFLLSGDTFTVIDAPGAVYGTAIFGINGTGDMVGAYYDASFEPRGFLLSQGTFTGIDAPDAAHGTLPVSINDAGHIVGIFTAHIATTAPATPAPAPARRSVTAPSPMDGS